MTVRDLLPLFCFGFDGIEPPEDLCALLRQGLGGVILFKRNLRDLEQVCSLTTTLHRHGVSPLLVGVDQEGGCVVRLPQPFLIPPPAAALGRIDDPELTHDVARAVGRELRAAGFTWNLAPVLDVHTNPNNPIIGDRAFSHDPQCVVRMGLAAFRGFQEAGILTTGKHFPGHGETAADSHLTLPESSQTAERWRAVEFVPFREAIRAGVPSILAAHLVCPALDPNLPSSLSRVIITDILRGELGFDGVVVSDDMEMGAIVTRFDIGEAAVRFLEAGGDLILICRDPDRQRSAVAAVESAVQSGRLSRRRVQASLDRLARLRARISSHSRVVSVESARVVVGADEHRALLARILAASSTLAERREGGPPPINAS
jgi:beta-N-acetylhexosaminidase